MNINLISDSEIEKKKEKVKPKPKMKDIFILPKGHDKLIKKKELELRKKKTI